VPGGIVTGIFAKAAGLEGAKADRAAEAAKELFASLQPIPRAGATEDIARAAVYLASDGASFVNGHNLVVDGGLSAIGRGWAPRRDRQAREGRGGGVVGGGLVAARWSKSGRGRWHLN
jgi:Enoyl-(Acyl carrier protein) reductase